MFRKCSYLNRSVLFLLTIWLLVGWNRPGVGQEIGWTKVTDHAGWQARDSQGELVFQDRMWILGGWFQSSDHTNLGACFFTGCSSVRLPITLLLGLYASRPTATNREPEGERDKKVHKKRK